MECPRRRCPKAVDDGVRPIAFKVVRAMMGVGVEEGVVGVRIIVPVAEADRDGGSLVEARPR